MHGLMAATADDKCLASARGHVFHPFWLLLASWLVQIRQFTDMVNFSPFS
jgi:hypothetical protein